MYGRGSHQAAHTTLEATGEKNQCYLDSACSYTDTDFHQVNQNKKDCLYIYLTYFTESQAFLFFSHSHSWHWEAAQYSHSLFGRPLSS